MGVLLGCIADDFTGATDLAGTLVREGMRTVQMIGIPTVPALDVDAVVIALKSRTTPVEDAISESLAALDWLRRAGCRQFFFKPTFPIYHPNSWKSYHFPTAKGTVSPMQQEQFFVRAEGAR